MVTSEMQEKQLSGNLDELGLGLVQYTVLIRCLMLKELASVAPVV